MQVNHIKLNNKGTFSLKKDGEEIGEMTYVFVNDKHIDINHTFIEKAYRGQDLGLELIKASVEFMKAHHLKAIPTCPYVKKVFDENPIYKAFRV
ncbi:GNAT family N-acetyltransferase [Mariniflexile ostreae]|uniref:GNAT family N-acetyltransferase n=1 Tax=Mariniflexile ostreae TaxID=1520892 RepID=A0ABV5F960_9FLAO